LRDPPIDHGSYHLASLSGAQLGILSRKHMSIDSTDEAGLRFPIGRYNAPAVIDMQQRSTWIQVLEELPAAFRNAVHPLTDEQLDTPYRPGGWTIRQVVHHVPDSHLNSYTRFRLALTEESPTIKLYEEARWAELPDAKSGSIGPSLDLLSTLHVRLVRLLRSMDDAAFSRTFRHPHLGLVRLDWNLGMYAWHGKHHLTHITSAIKRNQW
jgi:hypothetical protein